MDIDEEVANAINLSFIFVAGVICFLLQAGFGLLEAGAVRAKNAQNIMIKNMMDACVAAVAYYLVGYGFAYGTEGGKFIGLGSFALSDSTDFIIWYFNYVFAGTTATIVSGAVAERCRFEAYLIYSALLTAFIYPVCSHWIWSGDGWMGELGVLDFAGGGAVHGVGGMAALVGAYFLGPRIGRFQVDEVSGKTISTPIPGHNLVLSALGGFILWFGFFAFNGGSGYNIVGEGAVLTGRVATVTCLGGATGGITMMYFVKLKDGTWDMMMSLNGLLAGMIATCSCCNVIQPWAALLVGFTGAFVYYAQSYLTEHIFHIDDPLDAAALHMGAGFWGTIFAGLMADPSFVGEGQEGLFYGGGKQLGYQIMAVLAYGGWAFGTSSAMFGSLKYLGMLRVDADVELMGLDEHHHGGYSYRIKHQHEDNSLRDESMLGMTKHTQTMLSDEETPSDTPEIPEKPAFVKDKSVSFTKDEVSM